MLTLIDKGSLESIMGQPGSFKPLIDAGSHLYLQKMFELENRFTGALKAKLGSPPSRNLARKSRQHFMTFSQSPLSQLKPASPLN